MKTRTLAAMIAAVITLLSICSALPAAALSEKDAAYNAEDVALLRDFFETEDAEGVKIGEKLNPGVYDPDDPETWSFVEEYTNDFDGSLYSITHGISWEEIDGELRATTLRLYNLGITGDIRIPGCAYLNEVSLLVNRITAADVSECTGLRSLDVSDNELSELDISCCTELRELYCDSNELEELDLSAAPLLERLVCYSNELTRLDVSCCPELNEIWCYGNKLTKLDLSGCTKLEELRCENNRLGKLDLSDCVRLNKLLAYGNKLTGLDLTCNPGLYFDRINAEGSGYIGHGYMWDPYDECIYSWVNVRPNPGETFIGWFTESGELISTSTALDQKYVEYTRVTARFTGSLPVEGDASGDGVVNASDALIVLRAVLGLESGLESMLLNCDMDGDGILSASDALIILRIALGLE